MRRTSHIQIDPVVPSRIFHSSGSFRHNGGILSEKLNNQPCFNRVPDHQLLSRPLIRRTAIPHGADHLGTGLFTAQPDADATVNVIRHPAHRSQPKTVHVFAALGNTAILFLAFS